MNGREAGGDLVLIQTFLLYYVTQVVLMLTNFSTTISITKHRRFVSKQGRPQPHIHSKGKVLGPQL